MQRTEIIPLLLVGANCLFTWYAFKHRPVFSRYCFRIGDILQRKEYDRMVTSGFLHLDWGHLLFNMLALYSFAAGLYPLLGPVRFLVLYFGALLGGNLLALWMHHRQPGYTAAGASGAVSGVIFAGILLFPESKIMLFLLPIPLPGWFFGLAYMAFSLFGMKKQWGNIGHDAHLGGALTGLLLAILFFPVILKARLLLFAAMAVPPVSYLLYEWYRQRPVRIDQPRRKKPEAVSKAEEIWMEQMLERISAEGIGSVTGREKKKMHRISRKKRGG